LLEDAGKNSEEATKKIKSLEDGDLKTKKEAATKAQDALTKDPNNADLKKAKTKADNEYKWAQGELE